MEFLLILFIVLVGGGWLLGKGIGNLLFGEKKETYVDRSVHHHHYHNDNRSISFNGEDLKNFEEWKKMKK